MLPLVGLPNQLQVYEMAEGPRDANDAQTFVPTAVGGVRQGIWYKSGKLVSRSQFTGLRRGEVSQNMVMFPCIDGDLTKEQMEKAEVVIDEVRYGVIGADLIYDWNAPSFWQIKVVEVV